jgi:protein-arginine kinase activator protein McsA
LDKIEKKNKKKENAVANEEYELAVKYKNKINDLKNKFISY